MAWIQVAWRLTIPDPEEGDRGKSPLCDEPTLQFVLVTAFAGEVRAHPFTTPNLFPGGFGEGVIGELDPSPFGVLNSKNVPTRRNPFFGLAVRAVEQDNSGSNRAADNYRFYDAVRDASQEAFDNGETPTATTLWSAANSARPTDDFGDDDDFIGTSARVFPTYGSDNVDWLTHESMYPPGHPLPETREIFELVFQNRANTEYRLMCQVQLVTNDPAGALLVGELLAA